MSKKPDLTSDETNAQSDKLADQAEKVGRFARDLLHSHPFREGTQTLTTAICEKPVKSMMIACGIGLLIGKLLRR